MRIEIRGKNLEVTDELREAVGQRFARVGKQVSELATLEVELGEEKNPRIADRMVAEARQHSERMAVSPPPRWYVRRRAGGAPAPNAQSALPRRPSSPGAP